ncbi:glutamine--fructose-6-phosphate aminotransferase [Methanobrevibacter cuticularis]|uniref:Glutamine--fructose-6-phosphate aminotransferase [isomerizing] n=1 Tax=Methanobrevibacter cuticularis TaxID=47311 RepID=A0A166DY93_9EURY|nr:glutamine--fructose-6-phosphate transaminase (isomerizing) [Methanobrevibacter cuticularis]KZX16079.1 glutamine--fructose-6-phosphate aminotransferase [Methanobrevibacter cuticularis]
MCGIVGCILKNKKAAPVLLDCITKLEYRGYDSVGIATLDDNGIHVKKGSGQIKEVDEKIDLSNMLGDAGIAHVRWATHGIPNKENSHPHLDENENIAVVHNGIIENYGDIRESLEKEGHVFKSQTDTEVIPHLIEKYMSSGLDLEEALMETLTIIRGSYAIGAISKNNPNEIISARKDSPLIVGVGDNEYFIASDAPAILNYTNKIIYIDNGEIVILNEEGVTVKDSKRNILDKEVNIINWTSDMAEKEGYDYFMLKEIHEQNIAIKNTLIEKDNIKEIISDLDNINRICFVACGTSYHASLTGKYLIESMAGIPTDVVLASEFRYSANALNENTLVIFITQSGETADTLKALKKANETSKTIAIVNVLGSSATREADYVIYTKAGPEKGVAATKTYISQLVCIYLFAAILAQNKELLDSLKKVPSFIEGVLENESKIIEIAKKYKDARDFFFIGRGLSYPTALEGALKLKEITYIHAEGYAAGELKHGPLALIDNEIPVVVIAPPGDSYDKTMSNLEEVKARGAEIIAIGPCNDEFIKYEVADSFCIDDEISEILAPIVYIIPLQLLSYYISIERGLDPDKPKNLAKCVTVE